MWGVWRGRQSTDEFGLDSSEGDWVEETSQGDEVLFDTEEEAQNLAGIWNATAKGCVYIARKRFPW